MRKIIVTQFITLDGVVEAPGGSETAHPNGGWQNPYRSPETGKYKEEELASVDALLLGKNTYQQFVGYWPHQSGGGFADRINQLPKYVVSKSLPEVNWNNCQLFRDAAREVGELKNTEGGNILVYGSATLVKSLLRHDLVDEIRLLLYPVIVGGGLKLFDDDRSMKKFRLKHSKTFEVGVVNLEYVM